MSNTVEVVEKEISIPYLVNSFDMNVIFTELGSSCCVIVNTYDKEKRRLYEKQIVVEGDEYQAWGNDDNYLRLIVAAKLGLVIKTLY